ncbi:threonine-phosphate decarboxylase CobD [Synechocystis sp. LKSZ1]|uniref:threonine-phosphate decarboxylase CobD n=1 Tax=Synechocystis sp. LKSZ1 TaxID=3144951 RepID=UPI00336C0741
MNRPDHGGNLAWAVTLADCPVSSLLDFSASVNPLGPSLLVLQAIQGALTELCHYPDPQYQSLRQALAQHHDLDPAWILPGNGSAELLTLAGRALASLQQTLILTPAFGDYERALQGFQAPLTTVPWPPATPFPLTELQALASPQRGLILNNPRNPTGQLLAVEQILPLLDQFGLVVLDEAFIDFLLPHQQPTLIPALAHYPNLVILRSLTKFYSLPGLRLGYALGHPDLLQQWQRWRDPWPVNNLAEAAALAALEDRVFQEKTWAWLGPAREGLALGLGRIPGLFPYPSQANFLLVNTKVPAPWLQEQLLQQHRILIRDCLSFAGLGDAYFRVAVRTKTENQQLLQALAQQMTDRA